MIPRSHRNVHRPLRTHTRANVRLVHTPAAVPIWIVDRRVEQSVVVPHEHVTLLDLGEVDVLRLQDAELDVRQEGPDFIQVGDDGGLFR